MLGILPRLILKKQEPTFILACRFASGHCTARSIIGNREIVTFGVNGNAEYADRADYPMPSVRWKETTPNLCALKEKEKGDWHNLSYEEKKLLYRSSYCQTFAEFQAARGEWKSILGISLTLIGMGLWIYILEKYFVYNQKPLPKSFSDKSQAHQLRRMIDIENNPIRGIASQWDYKGKCWKK